MNRTLLYCSKLVNPKANNQRKMTLSGYSFPKFVTFRIENSDDLCGQDIEFSLLLKNIHDC